MEGHLITRDDLIKGGLCLTGVNEVIDRLWPIPAAMTVDAVIHRLEGGEVEQFSNAIGLNGDGYGYGNGDGYGYGNGDGYGYGDGDGDGDGNGNGNGYGYSDPT